MTLRTTSVRRQRQVWTLLAFIGVVSYFVLVTQLELGNPFLVFGSHQMRVLLPLVVVLRILAHECRWDGVVRVKVKSKSEEVKSKDEEVKSKGEEVKSKGEKVKSEGAREIVKSEGASEKERSEGAREVKSEGESEVGRGEGGVRHGAADGYGVECGYSPSEPSPVLFAPAPDNFPLSPSDDATGEDLFNRAREIPHQVIPDFETDGPYLNLLGMSAARGHASALAKLGEYAMRRAAWIEAYYWMSMARRAGMRNLASVMREIRKSWVMDGFPDEEENVNPLFSLEAGSIGRALIHVDSGHEAAKAREFLKEYYPELI